MFDYPFCFAVPLDQCLVCKFVPSWNFHEPRGRSSGLTSSLVTKTFHRKVIITSIVRCSKFIVNFIRKMTFVNMISIHRKRAIALGIASMAPGPFWLPEQCGALNAPGVVLSCLVCGSRVRPAGKKQEAAKERRPKS